MKNLWKNRSSIDIYAKIIEIAKDGVIKTRIMYGGNLGFNQLNRYLARMLDLEFLNIPESNPKIFKSTEKGLRFLEVYKKLTSYLKK